MRARPAPIPLQDINRTSYFLSNSPFPTSLVVPAMDLSVWPFVLILVGGLVAGWISHWCASTPCAHDLYSGWTKLTDVRKVGIPFRGRRYIATLNCYDESRYWKPVKEDFVVVPLDACPADASVETLNTTGIFVRELCPTPPRFREGVLRAVVKRPDFSAILIPSTNLLDSIAIGDDGNISVVDRHAYAVHKSEDITHPRPLRLWFAWRKKTPSGSIVFQHVDSYAWLNGGPLPMVWHRGSPYDHIDVPEKNVSLVLREFRSYPSAPAGRDHYISFEASLVPINLTLAEVLEGEDDTCAICLTQVNATIDRPLVCRHWFHDACLRQWLSLPGVQQLCPTCRARTSAFRSATRRPY